MKLLEKITKIYAHYGVIMKLSIHDEYEDRLILEVKLKGSTREAQLKSFAADVQQRLKLPLFVVFSDKFRIYIAVSEFNIKYPRLLKILFSPTHEKKISQMILPYVIGYDVLGELVIVDLALLNHILIGGASNSGKSVALSSLIMSIIVYTTPSEANFIIIDTGANDLMVFEGIPHLSCPIVRDKEAALSVLQALANELERRIDLENENPSEFDLLPRIVCVIDEFPALISELVDKHMIKQLTGIISSLLQRGRHVGIHLVISAQNPTLQNMKIDLGNITSRIALTCAKANNSRTILGESGAERLLGKGDMLFKSPLYNELQRIQGINITPKELKKRLPYLKNFFCGYHYMYKFEISDVFLQKAGEEIVDDRIKNLRVSKQVADDKLFSKIAIWALGRDSISCNMICDNFHIGWKRAKGFLERLHSFEITGDIYAKLPRAVLPRSIEDLPTQLLELLAENNFSSDDIDKALNNAKKES